MEMAFVERNQMVETLPTEASAQSLAYGVRLWRAHRRPQNLYTKVCKILVDFLSEDAVPIVG